MMGTAPRSYATDTPPPVLLDSIDGYNIVGFNGHIFSIPQKLGRIDLETANLEAYPAIVRHTTLADARLAIATSLGMACGRASLNDKTRRRALTLPQKIS